MLADRIKQRRPATECKAPWCYGVALRIRSKAPIYHQADHGLFGGPPIERGVRLDENAVYQSVPVGSQRATKIAPDCERYSAFPGCCFVPVCALTRTVFCRQPQHSVPLVMNPSPKSTERWRQIQSRAVVFRNKVMGLELALKLRRRIRAAKSKRRAICPRP